MRVRYCCQRECCLQQSWPEPLPAEQVAVPVVGGAVEVPAKDAAQLVSELGRAIGSASGTSVVVISPEVRRRI